MDPADPLQADLEKLAQEIVAQALGAAVPLPEKLAALKAAAPYLNASRKRGRSVSTTDGDADSFESFRNKITRASTGVQ